MIEVEKVNLIFLLAVLGAIVIGLALVFTQQDGFLLKGILVLLGVAMGIPLNLQDLLKGEKKE